MGNILIQNGLLVDTEWTKHADLLIEGSKIKRIAYRIYQEDCPEGTSVVHADGLCILPGIIDAHTHFHLVSRGTVTADSFIEGSRLAAFGGVTTVIDFADDNKVSLDESLSLRLSEMRDMAIDYALHQGVYKYRDTLKDELKRVKERGIGTIKIFTTYKDIGYLVEKRDELKAIFSICKELGLMVSVHSEDDKIITEKTASYKGEWKPSAHSDIRPAEAEKEAIKYVASIAQELDMPVYIVHLSSKEGLEEARDMREKGVRIILETTPTYLFLNRSLLERDDGALFVMTPPLRTKEDNDALKDAVENGEIQIIATDHCAFTREQKLKEQDPRKILPGIPGTEELLPLIHTFSVSEGNLNLSQIVNLLSTGPAKEFGLYPKKGILREGSDADIVLFDPDESWTLSKDTLHSASGYTAYEGVTVTGKVVMTYLRGRLIMGDGIYLGLKGDGQFVKAER